MYIFYNQLFQQSKTFFSDNAFVRTCLGIYSLKFTQALGESQIFHFFFFFFFYFFKHFPFDFLHFTFPFSVMCLFFSLFLFVFIFIRLCFTFQQSLFANFSNFCFGLISICSILKGFFFIYFGILIQKKKQNKNHKPKNKNTLGGPSCFLAVI